MGTVQPISKTHRVVIIGGGFGGLYTAKALGKAPVEVVLVDRRNFHLFQPLLYQVATGGISPGNIAAPLRAVLKNQRNTIVLMADVVDILPEEKKLRLNSLPFAGSGGDNEFMESLRYDTLVVSTGVTHHYFGHDEWMERAVGLKTVEDALEMRRRIFLAFEAAERENDEKKREAWMTFVIVGGGATGVELAGALGELAHETLKKDFRRINPRLAKIFLLEGTDRILPSYPPELSKKAQKALEKLGVTVLTKTFVTDVREDEVEAGGRTIRAKTVLWAAGVKASDLGKILAQKTGSELDGVGRVKVQPDLSLPKFPEIFVIGDLAHCLDEDGKALPGVAQVAMQQGGYVARTIRERLQNRSKKKSSKPFRYKNYGNLAVIGRNSAVADLPRMKLSGFVAWLIWIFVHIRYLIQFDSKILVMFQWAWSYFTKNRGARLIVGKGPSDG